MVCIKQLVSAESTGKKRKASASKNASTDGSQLEEAAEADEPPAQAIYNAALTRAHTLYCPTIKHLQMLWLAVSVYIIILYYLTVVRLRKPTCRMKHCSPVNSRYFLNPNMGKGFSSGNTIVLVYTNNRMQTKLYYNNLECLRCSWNHLITESSSYLTESSNNLQVLRFCKFNVWDNSRLIILNLMFLYCVLNPFWNY